MYDSLISHTLEYFQAMSPNELMIMFKEAKEDLSRLHDYKRKKKVNSDINIMRHILKG